MCLCGASGLYCCYVALCSCATVMGCVEINTYLSGVIKLWLFLTAQGAGSFLVRYTNGIMKQTYCALNKFCNFFFTNIPSIKKINTKQAIQKCFHGSLGIRRAHFGNH